LTDLSITATTRHPISGARLVGTLQEEAELGVITKAMSMQQAVMLFTYLCLLLLAILLMVAGYAMSFS
jgi:hypothetical protein